jgi:hypothetical protein
MEYRKSASKSRMLLVAVTSVLTLAISFQGGYMPGVTAQESVKLAVNEKNSASTPASKSPKSYQRILDRYCVTCHNETLKTGNLRLDNVDLNHIAQDGELWEKVIQKLRTNSMPPADKPQPPKGANDEFLSLLVTTLDEEAAENPNPGRPAVHRLNRSEYANAIRDLLGLEIDSREFLPTDGSDFGFDNIADSLNVSPMLLERYIMAASKISRLAIGDANVRPSTKIYTLPKALMQTSRMDDELSFGSRGGLSVRHRFPLDGEYVIKVNVESPRSDQPQDLFQRSDAPEQLDVRVDGQRVGAFTIGLPKSTEWKYGKNGFAGDEPAEKEDLADWWGARTLEARFEAKQGMRTIGVTFLNRTLAYEGVRPRHFPAFYDYLGLLKGVEPGVIDFEISGPFEPGEIDKDSPSRRKIFTNYPQSPDEERSVAKEILSKLARQAYRRPITDYDVDTLLEFFDAGKSDGGFESGIQFALERILVSPSFIFRVEADPVDTAANEAYPLTDLELASRLSFFLWSSIPDDELLAAAERGELKEPSVLENQVLRMLADPKSESLVKNFATQWLYLRNIDAVTPDVNAFPDFDDNLRYALKKETELFFTSQLREDRSLVNLLDADYTYLNERLAEHYGISGISGNHFRRVQLDDPNRRGILGQGSLLTVTSYATRTSPVKRGKWILENILGSPPPAPPPDVPDLPEASEQIVATTVRERMEEHRKNPACASCHVRMDPIGFSLENFDAIGKWRSTDPQGLAIDAHGLLPDGTVLKGPAGLSEVLSGKNEDFTLLTIQKLLTYAVGREIHYYDKPAIRQVAREAEPFDYSWSSVILGIVRSTPFQMRRASS